MCKRVCDKMRRETAKNGDALIIDCLPMGERRARKKDGDSVRSRHPEMRNGQYNKEETAHCVFPVRAGMASGTRCASGVARRASGGRMTVNVLPCSGALLTSMYPPTILRIC